MFISIAPDFDLLIPFLDHRTATHSILIGLIVFLPFLIKNKKGLPYYAAFVSHPLIGDMFTSYGVQLLWPLQTWFVAPPPFYITSSMQPFVEIPMFVAMSFLILYRFNKYIVKIAAIGLMGVSSLIGGLQALHIIYFYRLSDLRIIFWGAIFTLILIGLASYLATRKSKR